MATQDSNDAQQLEHKNADSDVQPAKTTPDTPLMADVSAEEAPAVGEFMAQASAQNEAAKEELKDTTHSGKRKTEPFISFVNVSKAFGPVVVLKNMNFFVNPGETLC